MRHIAICGLSGCTDFFQIISKTAGFGEGVENKMCFFSTILSKTFLILRRIQ